MEGFAEGRWQAEEPLSWPWVCGKSPSTSCDVCAFPPHQGQWYSSSCLTLGPSCISLVLSPNISPSSLGQRHVEYDNAAAFQQHLEVDSSPVSMVITKTHTCKTIWTLLWIIIHIKKNKSKDITQCCYVLLVLLLLLSDITFTQSCYCYSVMLLLLSDLAVTLSCYCYLVMQLLLLSTVTLT